MANPNIVNVQDIRGKTAVQSITSSETAIVSNSVSSNAVLKINTLVISNIDEDEQNVTVDIFRSSTSYSLAFEVVVPPNATLVAISKDTGIYLEEGDSLRLKGSDISVLDAICSYEEIS